MQDFDPRESGYDETTAKNFNLQPDASGHYSSRLPLKTHAVRMPLNKSLDLKDVGLMLKGEKHDTFELALQEDRKKGYHNIRSNENNRIYSVKRHPNTTLGMVNNNPGNLKATDDWYGSLGEDLVGRENGEGYGHAVFETLEQGKRALIINLLNRQKRKPNQTLTEYMQDFKTDKDAKEAEFISTRLSITPETKLKDINMYNVASLVAMFESKIKSKPMEYYRLSKIKDPRNL